MFTSVLMLALTVQTNAQQVEPTWAPDYAQALKRGADEKKPVAVFLGTGNQGYTQAVNEGSLSPAVSEILSMQYVCVYIDTTTADGKRLAEAFAMPTGRGIVLSDRSGVYKMFSREGAISNQEMVRQLQTNSSYTSYYGGTSTEAIQAPAGKGPARTGPAPTGPAPGYAPGYAPAYGPAPGYCPACQGRR